jgi:Tol biopolymer transport system component
VSADGSGEPQLLTQGKSPAWSPDGSRIAFTR